MALTPSLILQGQKSPLNPGRFTDLANPTFQDNANEAIHRFITSKTVA